MKLTRLLFCLWIALGLNAIAILLYYAKEVWS